MRNFRNYEDFELNLHNELTVIHGPNAIGKTNLIEALQLVTAGESFRKPAWNEVIREGAEAAQVKLFAEGDNRLLEVVLDLEVGKRRRYFVNGSQRKNISGSNGSTPSVLFTPEDLGIIKGPSEQRRTAVDSLGEQLSATYKSLRREYQRILKQRNSLLKEGDDSEQLEVWTHQLIQVGARLMKHRNQLVEKLAMCIAVIHQELVVGEDLHVRYVPSWDRDTGDSRKGSIEEWPDVFADTLTRHHSRESRRGTSLYGPHRDEIEILLQGKAARAFSSQGQQRSIALAWKLAEVDVVEDVLGIQPLLLLDDVMSELDKARRALLTARVQRAAQTVITTTNLPYFDSELLSKGIVVTLG